MARITLLCIRYRRNRKPWVLTSSQVRKPMPPTTMRAQTVSVTPRLPEKAVREEKAPVLAPMMSNPALQKADTEWKTAIQIPAAPYRPQNQGSSSSAPRSSVKKAMRNRNPVSFTMPPI